MNYYKQYLRDCKFGIAIYEIIYETFYVTRNRRTYFAEEFAQNGQKMAVDILL